MSTVNIVLMVILSCMIGFAIGNVWGKESMKRTFSELLQGLTDGLKLAASQANGEKDKKSPPNGDAI